MPWIEVIPYESSDGALRTAYDRVKGPDGAVDNVLAVHSLRPHTLDGHMALYKSVLHNSANTLPKWFLETLGVWVSALNTCGYCVTHHTRGMRRLLRDDQRAVAIIAAIERRDILPAPLDEAQKIAMRYVELLTRDPALVDAAIIRQMREAGLDDGQILEINQVCSYFCYVNRTVLGLGCELESDPGDG
jgi:uncharacterized peroxidase-related enzyme